MQSPPWRISLHFVVSASANATLLRAIISSSFPYFNFQVYSFHDSSVARLISASNTGVMVMDLARWREGGYTEKIEEWTELQKRVRIYELGSLPPFPLVFAGKIVAVNHRWNQHGLGGENYRGLCRDLHPVPVSLLHWSGKGKPWARLDANRPCPLLTPYERYVTNSVNV